MQTEEEYIIATNRVKVSLAQSVLRDCMEGDKYGIDEITYRSVIGYLVDMEDRLFELIQIAPTEDKEI